MAGFPPKFLSAVIKIYNNPEMSEYNLTAIFIWPVLAIVVKVSMVSDKSVQIAILLVMQAQLF